LNLNDATDVVTDGGCGIALVSWMSFIHPSIHQATAVHIQAAFFFCDDFFFPK
jgi:hypothetical protein